MTGSSCNACNGPATNRRCALTQALAASGCNGCNAPLRGVARCTALRLVRADLFLSNNSSFSISP
jgi:hypothetical protein